MKGNARVICRSSPVGAGLLAGLLAGFGALGAHSQAPAPERAGGQAAAATPTASAGQIAAGGSVAGATAGTAPSLPPSPIVSLQPAPLQGAGGSGSRAPQSGPAITLDEALRLAQANEPSFVAAVAASRVAALNRSIARSSLLPQALYHNQYLYTQSAGLAAPSLSAGTTGAQPLPRFIANNGVHEYVSQGVVNETVGVLQLTALAQASAAAAISNANLEISRRGLAATVVSRFYAVTTSESKIAVVQRALDDSQSFVTQTQERERAREAAHADVIKAQLTLQQRQRDLANARLLTDRAKIDLGVLLFPDPRTPYVVSLPASSSLPTREAIEHAARMSNPVLDSALLTLRSTSLGVAAAQAAYLPNLALNYTYGIDANQFATSGPNGLRNLGYSASATLDIPLWDWLATQHRVRQAQILRDAAKVSLSATQRNLIAQLEEFYAEASLAESELDSLQLSVRTAGESLRLTRLRYSAGEATVLEVVDAENSNVLAEVALADGTVRYHVARANLQLLTGTI